MAGLRTMLTKFMSRRNMGPELQESRSMMAKFESCVNMGSKRRGLRTMMITFESRIRVRPEFEGSRIPKTKFVSETGTWRSKNNDYLIRVLYKYGTPLKSMGPLYVTMTSSNGNIFRVTGHLCGECTGPRRIPRTKASDTKLWCFLWSASE